MKRFLVLFWCFLSIYKLHSQESSDDYFSAFITPDSVFAGESGAFTLYILPKKTIKVNTVFKIKFLKGFKDLQRQFASLPGYVKGSISPNKGQFNVTTVNSSYNESLEFWDMNVQDRVITAAIRNTDVGPGDTLIITIGVGAELNKTAAPTTAWKEDIEIAMADNGTAKNFKLAQNFIPFRIVGRPAQKVYLFTNSIARPGEESKLLITTADEYFNIDPYFTGKILLSASGPGNVVLPNVVELLPEDSGKKEIPVYFLKEGYYNIQGEVEGKSIPVQKSNPVKVDIESPFIYWGDLHSHGAPSRDGLGTGRYEYARYARALDFMCATDHADHGKTIYGITDREWARQIAEIRANHVPGKFIPLIGYENSFLYPTGHYNIIFNVKDEELENVPMWTMRNVNDIQTVWSLSQERNIDVLTIPHHCGKVFNADAEGVECKNCNTFGGIQANSKYKRLLEIYSFHGLSESYNPNHNLNYTNRSSIARSFDGPNYAQDAWAIGERLGVIASSDDHTGHPGSIINGVAAVYANELDRDTLFSGLKNRQTYGTTGERIILDFKVEGAVMGSAIEIDPKSSVEIFYEVAGTDTIDFIEILKWDFKSGVYKDGHPQYEIIYRGDKNSESPFLMKGSFIDEGMTDSCMYYLRAKQTNSHIEHIHQKDVWAWTSPIWVSNRQDSISTNDSLRTYAPSIQGKFIRHQWSMVRNQYVTHYSIERKVENDLWLKIFDLEPTISDQKIFEYIETSPKNGISEYRLAVYSENGDTIYSDVKEVQITLDTITNNQIEWEENHAVISWNTLNEIHTLSYIIEKEIDGNYIPLDVVTARRNLGEINSFYTWSTEDLPVGKHLYRLVQVIDDENRNYFYLEIERVATKSDLNKRDKAFVIKENIISTGQPNIEIRIADELAGSELQLVDMSGRRLQILGKVEKTSSWQSYWLRNLPSGAFRVILILPSGAIYTQPIVVVN